MDLGDVESSLKVVVIGSEGVGKSSLVYSFCRNDFLAQYRKTIGTEFKEKNIELPDTFEELNLMIWEIGGEHTFKPNNIRHFKDANAVIIMFSTSDRESFERVRDLHAKAKEESGNRALVILVQNKIDLINDAKVTIQETEKLSRELRTRLYRASCKDHAVVEKIFLFLASKLNGSAAVALANIDDVLPEISDDSGSQQVEEKEDGDSPVYERPGEATNSPSFSAPDADNALRDSHQSFDNKMKFDADSVKSGSHSTRIPTGHPSTPMSSPQTSTNTVADNQSEILPTMPSKQRTKGQSKLLACLPFL